MATVTDPIGVDLSRTLKTLKLSGLKDTLPERLVLAGQGPDEPRRIPRAAKAGLDPTMRLEGGTTARRVVTWW